MNTGNKLSDVALPKLAGGWHRDRGAQKRIITLKNDYRFHNGSLSVREKRDGQSHGICKSHFTCATLFPSLGRYLDRPLRLNTPVIKGQAGAGEKIES